MAQQRPVGGPASSACAAGSGSGPGRSARESAEQVAERHETGSELAEMLGELPEEQLLAVVLRPVADLPIAEIAIVLGSPQGTVKSHMSRGLGRLRLLREGGAP